MSHSLQSRGSIAAAFCAVALLLQGNLVQAATKAQKNAAEIKSLEKQLAEVQSRMSQSNSYYLAIKSDLAKGLDKVQRANKIGDLTAALVFLPGEVKAAAKVTTFKELGKNLVADRIVDITKVAEPSTWASLYGRAVNFIQSGRKASVEQELHRAMAGVENDRMNTGIEYVRRIQLLKNKIASLK